jgi:hypothetical protein
MHAEILDRLTLSPVVEFAPRRYAQRERPYPNVCAEEDPMGWQAYWLACLADAGITELLPICPGSWLVSTARLESGPTIQRLLEANLAISGLAAERLPDALDGHPLVECVSPLDGGYVLSSGERTLAEPACCGDLGNLAEWRAGLEDESGDWHSIWTGHDGVTVSTRSGGLGLRLDSTEYRLHPGILAAAIDEAGGEVRRFEARVRRAATGLVPNLLVEELARCLVKRT